MRVEPWMWAAWGLGFAWLVALLGGPAFINRLSEAGRWDAAVRTSRWWAWLAGTYGEASRLELLGYSGRIDEALIVSDGIRATRARPFTRMVLVLVNTLITAGRYRSALEEGQAEPGPDRALFEVNLAEGRVQPGELVRGTQSP